MAYQSARDYFTEKVPQLIQSRAAKLKSIDAIYEFQISGADGGLWYLDLKSDPIGFGEGTHPDTDCTVVMKDKHFVKLINGEMNPKLAFLTGKLKVTGNMALALKLSTLFD